MLSDREEVAVMRSLLTEQAAQIRILSDLGNYLVQAHFAFVEQHSLLLRTLCFKGLISNEDLLAQTKESERAQLLYGAISEPQVASTLVRMLGVPAAQNLLLISHQFATSLGEALERFEEAARSYVDAVKHYEGRSAGESGPVESAPAAGAQTTPRDRFLVLLQEAWQYSTLAESISRALGPAAFQPFCAVSRAGCECMRSARKASRRTDAAEAGARSGASGGRAARAGAKKVAVGQQVPDGPPAPKGGKREEEQGAGFPEGSPAVAAEAAIERAEPRSDLPSSAPRDKPAKASERPRGVSDPGVPSRTEVLFRLLWREAVLPRMLKSCLGDASKKAFRAVCCAGRELKPPEERGGQTHLRRAAEKASSRALVPAEAAAHVPESSKRLLQSQGADSGRVKLVQLRNLKTRVELNGAIGRVTDFLNSKDQRWNVVLPTGEVIRVRSKNCLVLPEEGELCDAPPGVRGLKWLPEQVAADASVEMCVFTARVPAREIAFFLDRPAIYDFIVTSALVRDSLAVTGKLLVCGGVDSSRVLSSMECFDLYTNSWIDPPPPPMVRPRGGAASCVYGGNLYLAGGSDYGTGWLNTLERYDMWSGEWKVLPPMKTARIYASMVPIKGFLYVVGGHTQHNLPVQSVERFDPQRRVWKEMSSMNERRTVPMVGAHDSTLFVFGGCDRNYLSTVECYDTSSDFWRRLPPMMNCCAYAGMALDKGCFYSCGGTGYRRGSRGLKGAELSGASRFVVARSRWEELPRMLTQRSQFLLVVRGDILFASGGCKQGMPSVEALDLKMAQRWEAVGPPLLHEWIYGVTAVIAEHIYVLGGRSSRQNGNETESVLLNTVVRYSMSGHEWEELPPMYTKRTFATCFHSCV